MGVFFIDHATARVAYSLFIESSRNHRRPGDVTSSSCGRDSGRHHATARSNAVNAIMMATCEVMLLLLVAVVDVGGGGGGGGGGVRVCGF